MSEIPPGAGAPFPDSHADGPGVPRQPLHDRPGAAQTDAAASGASGAAPAGAPAAPPQTLYDVLEVSPRASAPVIKAAYRVLAQMCHPDKNPGDAQASDRLAQIVRAYRVLSSAEQRARYDHLLAQTPARPERRGRPAPAAPRAADPHASASGVQARRFAFRPLK